MINIMYTNERFAATELNMTGDYFEWRKVDSIRTPTEVLNKLPESWYILYPNESVNFSLPVKPGEEILTVYTGRIGTANFSDIVVTMSSGETVECPIDSHSVTSCSLNVAEYVQEALQENTDLQVEISVHGDSLGSSSIWEIDLNNGTNDVNIRGFFEEDAKQVLKSTRERYGNDSSLSMITFIGSKQVGKSTIASLVSGNSSMFQMREGVDLSPVIPSEAYAERMTDMLNHTIQIPPYSLPLFLMDTEAMGVRGESFEFISTSTPSIISKMIVWVDDHNGLDPDRILKEIDGYITHLTKVVTENSYQGDNDCQNVTFGEFKIVVNKMTDDWDDNMLQENLLAIEAGMTHDAIERDRIRDRIKTCFNGYSAIGLPLLNINEDETISYDILTERFKQGLAQIASEILNLSLIQKKVLIGGQEKEMSTAQGEIIIGALVDQANEGVIDLSGFHSYWAFKKQEVQQELDNDYKKLELGHCLGSKKSLRCSKCVCAYRNNIIDDTIENLKNKLLFIAGEAKGLFQENVDEEMEDLKRTVIDPWIEDNKCSQVVEKDYWNGIQCDIGSVQFAANNFELECQTAFICGHIMAPYTDFTLLVNGSVFVEEGAVIEFEAPDQARSGSDANGFEANGIGLPGENGEHGNRGANVVISAFSLMPLSGTTLDIISKGGDGGNGGAGGNGADGTNGIQGQLAIIKEEVFILPGTCNVTSSPPRNAEEVCKVGDVFLNENNMFVEGRCSGCSILLYNHIYSYRYQQTYEEHGTAGLDGANGTDGQDGFSGGSGGNGGDGGFGGTALIQIAGITAVLERVGGFGGEGGQNGLGGKGGFGGEGGEGEPGEIGFRQTKIWTAKKRYSDNFICDGCRNTLEETDQIYDNYLETSQEPEPCCQGPSGCRGSNGRHGDDGSVGSSGAAGEDVLYSSVIVQSYQGQ